jgi:hypothetical protein
MEVEKYLAYESMQKNILSFKEGDIGIKQYCFLGENLGHGAHMIIVYIW